MTSQKQTRKGMTSHGSIITRVITTLVIVIPLLTSSCSALRHPSYNERLLTSAKVIHAARTRLDNADVTAASSHDVMKCRSDDVRECSKSPRDALFEKLMSIDRDVVLRSVLESVNSLLGNFDVSAFSDVSATSSSEDTPQEYERCLNDTAATVTAMVAREPWAMKMLDAMGKPLPGVSEGNLLWIGAYDLCHKVKVKDGTVKVNDTIVWEHINFNGKYSGIYVPLAGWVPGDLLGQAYLDLGVCIPDTCSDGYFTYILTDVVKSIGLNIPLGVITPPRLTTLDTKAIVAIVVCVVLAVCLVVGTVIDVWLVRNPQWRPHGTPTYASANGRHSIAIGDESLPLLSDTSKTATPYQPGVGVKLLLAFSVYTNGSKLLSTSQPAGSITAIHGIRFLSMTWVVLGHGFLFPMGLGANVAEFLEKNLQNWTFQTICNAPVAVDTFFVLSGLLVAYLTLKELDKRGGKLNWFMYYFHRFWRLTPAYMLVIMVYACLSPYWCEGPSCPLVNYDRNSCNSHWWTNLLYINNIVHADEQCLGQSWYLANDMQFYCILSPLVIIPLYFSPVLGYVISGALVLGHCISNAVLTMQNDYPPGVYARVQSNHTDMAGWGPDFYMKPYTRWGPYVIGLLAGYCLYRTKCKIRIHWLANLSLWALAAGSAMSVLYGLHGASNGSPLTVPVSALYNAVHRNVWGLCISWVVVACASGNGGFVNTLLSWSAFVPLSRLTYCIYLLHIMIMDTYLVNQDSVFYCSDINAVMFVLAVLVVSYMASFVASLAFEAPMMALEKIIIPRGTSRDTSRDSAD